MRFRGSWDGGFPNFRLSHKRTLPVPFRFFAAAPCGPPRPGPGRAMQCRAGRPATSELANPVARALAAGTEGLAEAAT